MDGLTFHKVIGIVKQRYIGSSVNRVSLLKDQLYLSLFKDKHITLLFKTNPPSLELTGTALGESAAVLANLSGAKLTDVGNRPYDRLGWLIFEKRRPSGKIISYKLVLEPMGNYANAFLLGDDNTILFRISGKNIDPDRDIGVGKPYIAPRANKSYSLDNPGNTADFNDLTGFYPLTATLANRYRDEIGYVQTIMFIKQELDSDVFYLNEKGKIIPFSPSEEAEQIIFDKLSWTRGSGQNNSQPEAKVSEDLRKFYAKQFDHYQKLAGKLEKELNDALKYPEINEEADLIKSNLHLIREKGVYVLTQYSEAGANEIQYTYSSDETPAVYANKLYQRVSKLKRAVPLLQERLAQTKQLAESAEEQIYYVEHADIYALKELSELLKKDKTGKQAKKQEGGFLEYHKSNVVFYIGRNSASNHKLVFQFAQPGDMWMHAQKIPSAHCIIRSATLLSDDILHFAAKLTAAHSKNKSEQKVPVDYTLKKYVRKPKNTPPGFVIYDHFKTLLVQPFTEEEIKNLNITNN